MKKTLLFFIFILSVLYTTYAQKGNVGVNTTDSKATLDVERNLRIQKVEENTGAASNRILTTDVHGVVKVVKSTNFGAMGTTKVSCVGLRDGKNPIEGREKNM